MKDTRIHYDRCTEKVWKFLEQQFGKVILEGEFAPIIQNEEGTTVGLHADSNHELLVSCEIPEPLVEMLDGETYEIVTNLALWIGDSVRAPDFGSRICFASERTAMQKALAAALVK